MKTIRDIQTQLALTFHNPVLAMTAFTHTSFVNEHAHQQLESNERLEFLGDAVLEILVSEFLYKTYPTLPEGQLTRMRAQLVCEPSLAYLTKTLEFDQVLKLGNGEEASGGRQRDSILADCFEAFLGAIYLDQGLDVARNYLHRVMLSRHQALLNQIAQDYKTLFQERVQQNGAVTIQYRLIKQVGPAHDILFEMGLYVNDELIAVGQGRNKKAAQVQAAQNALHYVDEKGNINVSK